MRFPYEKRHPNNPLGLKPSDNCISLDDEFYKTYSLNLLPIDESNVIDNINLNLNIVSNNNGNKSIKSYSGKIALQSENCKETLILDIPNEVFDPIIASNQVGKIVKSTKIDNFTVIRAIKNPQSITVYLTNGILTFDDNSQITIQ